MSWDITKPAGTDPASGGDDIIRELKTDLEGAFRGQDSDGLEAKFPGADTSAPVFRYRGLRGSTASRPTAGDYGLYIDTTRNALQRDNGSSWDDIGTLIPAGTVMVFYQASAPVGWTKVVTQNDKALRVVSGSGGSAGGTVALSTTLAHTHTVASHTHSIDTQGAMTTDGPSGINSGGGGLGSADSTHTHNTPAHNHNGATGAASPATDSQLGALAYIDVLICSKD
jgi:hypothetical protein